ncbi:tetratricopeptide repeat-containing diguanylate cyclase [Shewanella sp. GXUN23E]|uniref:tetratricopeptide repeat-containing diguanylate cyclase n=1 Tax=Shewanella sp. GXUN23E TaxID=3422498 RepID=UPI003D7E8784
MRLLLAVILLSVSVWSLPVRSADANFQQQLNELQQLLSTEPLKAKAIIDALNPSLNAFTRNELTRFYTLSSVFLIISGDYDNAYSQLMNAKHYARDNEEYVDIYHYLATVEVSRKHYAESLQYAGKVLSLIKDIGDSALQVKSYNRIFSIFFQLEAYTEAREYAQLAYNLNTEREPVSLCTSMLYIGLSYQSLNDYDNAHQWFDESLSFCKQHNIPVMVAMSQKAKALAYYQTGDYQASLKLFEASSAGYMAFSYQLEITHVDSWLAENYFQLGQLDQAQQYALKVLSGQDLPEYLDARKRAVRVMADIYYGQGQYQQAYDYQKDYLAYTEKQLSDTFAKSLSHQMAKFDSDEKERQINLLEQERGIYVEQRQVEHQQQANITLMLLLTAGGLVISALVILIGLSQRSRYKRMAQLDSLTGVMNRGTGLTKAENAYIAVMTRKSTMALILLDLDNFKEINDKHGHSTGDWALKRMVDVVKSNVRRTDILVRLGGEEFAIFLPDMCISDAEVVAESIRMAIQHIQPQYAEQPFELTASFGVTVSDETDLSLDPILSRADIALLQAKNSGQNRVVVYGQSTLKEQIA